MDGVRSLNEGMDLYNKFVCLCVCVMSCWIYYIVDNDNRTISVLHKATENLILKI